MSFTSTGKVGRILSASRGDTPELIDPTEEVSDEVVLAANLERESQATFAVGPVGDVAPMFLYANSYRAHAIPPPIPRGA